MTGAWTIAEKRFLGGALVVALAFRFLHWQSLAPHPWFDFLGLDALYYDQWAKRILREGLQGRDPYFMGPLYPHFLALVYKVAGPGLDAVRWIQLLVSTGSVALIHLLARRFGGPVPAMAASGIAAVYGPFVYYSTSILYPTLTVFLATSLLLLLFESASRKSVRLALAAGAVMGLYALGRGNILLFAPPAFFWLVAAWGAPLAPRLGDRRALAAGMRGGIALAAGTVAMILPATLHNLRTGDPALLTTNGGLNFYIGNGPMANGGHMTPVLFRERPDGTVERIEADLTKDVECRTEAELATGRSMTYTEVSSFWFQETGKHIRREPARFLRGLLRKSVHFWSAYEIPQIEHFGYFRRFSLPLRGPVLSFGLLGPFAVVGMALALRRWRRWSLLLLFVAAYSTSIVLFFVLARYRLPILPALIPFAVHAVLEMVRAARERRPWAWAAPLGGCALVGWLMHANLYRIDESRGIAQILYRHGIVADAEQDWDGAIRNYQEALRLKPEYAKGHLNLGVDLARVGRTQEAMQHLQEAERLDPDYYRAPYNRGALLEQLGRSEDAEAAYAQALELEPRYLIARLAVGEMRFGAGDTASARVQFAGVLGAEGVWEPQSDEAARAQARRWMETLESRSRLARESRGDCFGENELLRRAQVAWMRGRIRPALAELKEFFESGGHCAEAYFTLGLILLEIEEVNGSRDALERTLAADEDWPGARLALGRLAASQGAAADALELLREETRRRPQSPDAYLEIGLVHERLLGDSGAAEEWFDRYLEAGGAEDMLKSRRQYWQAQGEGP